MAIDPSELLEISEKLLEEDKEINYRTSANRAYYSIYHLCAPLANSLPRIPVKGKGKGSHARKIFRLENHPIKSNTEKKDNLIRALGKFWAKENPTEIKPIIILANNLPVQKLRH